MIAATLKTEEKPDEIGLLLVLEPGNLEKLKMGQPIVKKLRQYIPELGVEVELTIGYTPDSQYVVDQMSKGRSMGEALKDAQFRPEVYVPMSEAENMRRAEDIINRANGGRPR